MDKGSTLIMLAIIFAILLPFIILNIIKRVRIATARKRLDTFTRTANLNTGTKEFLPNGSIIGLDSGNKKIVYLNTKERGSEPVMVDLQKVEKTRIVTTDSLHQTDGKASNRVHLVFALNNSPGKEIALEFYNNPGLMPASHHYDVVQKWADTVNTLLAGNKISRS